MPEPMFTRHPVEYFGHPYTDNTVDAMLHQEEQHCPYLESECMKPRKSEPQVKVGVCTVGYKGKFMDGFEPVVVCPHRYSSNQVFDHIAIHYFPPDTDSFVKWVPEVSIGLGGSVDYVLAKFKTATPTVIEDFICIEFQAAGTTGTPWEAVLEFQSTRQFTKGNYKYGINWANEFGKTMMQQVYKKGMITESWNKRIVFVLQDVGMSYLKSGAYNTTGLRDPASYEDPIQFYTMRMQWDDGTHKWSLIPCGVVGTDLEGIRKMLSGSESDDYITMGGFLQNIRRKLGLD